MEEARRQHVLGVHFVRDPAPLLRWSVPRGFFQRQARHQARVVRHPRWLWPWRGEKAKIREFRTKLFEDVPPGLPLEFIELMFAHFLMHFEVFSQRYKPTGGGQQPVVEKTLQVAFQYNFEYKDIVGWGKVIRERYLLENLDEENLLGRNSSQHVERVLTALSGSVTRAQDEVTRAVGSIGTFCDSYERMARDVADLKTSVANLCATQSKILGILQNGSFGTAKSKRKRQRLDDVEDSACNPMIVSQGDAQTEADPATAAAATSAAATLTSVNDVLMRGSTLNKLNYSKFVDVALRKFYKDMHWHGASDDYTLFAGFDDENTSVKAKEKSYVSKRDKALYCFGVMNLELKEDERKIIMSPIKRPAPGADMRAFNDWMSEVDKISRRIEDDLNKKFTNNQRKSNLTLSSLYDKDKDWRRKNITAPTVPTAPTPFFSVEL